VGEAGGEPRFAFIEANPRLQVEHTVTEAVTGLDLVALQLGVAGGATLAQLGLGVQAKVPAPHGVALQARINLETLTADGQVRPPAASWGLRAAVGPRGSASMASATAATATSARYDSLLAKLIVHAADLSAAAAKANRALGEFRLTGVASNIPFLQALTQRLAKGERGLHTRYVEEHMADLVARRPRNVPAAHFGAARDPAPRGARSMPSIRWRCCARQEAAKAPRRPRRPRRRNPQHTTTSSAPRAAPPPRPAARHHRQPLGRARRGGPRRPAGGDHGIHEDEH